MSAKSIILGFSAMLMVTFIALPKHSAAQDTNNTEQSLDVLEEIVVTAQRRSLIDLGDLFRTPDPDPGFVDPQAIQAETYLLSNGCRYEKFRIGDQQWCFEVREPNPLDSFDTGIVYQRRC